MSTEPLEPNWQAFAPIYADNHAGYIYIVVLYSLIFTILACSTRLWIKKNNLGNDDYVYGAASLAVIAHITCLFIALKHGLGTVATQHASTVPSTVQQYSLKSYHVGGKATFASAIFLIVALALAKCSVVLFMQRLLARDLKALNIACWVVIGVSLLWGVGSIIGISVGCQTSSYILDDAAERCGMQSTKWSAITAFDAVTELLIIAIPIVLVRPLQMSRKLKWEVVSAFMFRIGVIATAVVHAIYVNRFASSQHPSMTLVPVIIAAECELSWSILSATIPNLKNFMRSFNTGFGHEFGLTTMNAGSGYGKSSRDPHPNSHTGRGIQLSRISRRDKHGGASGRDDFQVMNEDLNPEGVAYGVDVGTGHARDNASVGSGKSQEMIIRKDVVMTVEENGGSHGISPTRWRTRFG
ncbi:hypothetical protein LTR10_008007 [Elasticomyces elasticus]|nr:hypothetical protein LTR10_008007 [Elasticomyces elasticus]KAK4971004.1 hypothetical protein LTR42_007983 [Elasticomyces elasticus]